MPGASPSAVARTVRDPARGARTVRSATPLERVVASAPPAVTRAPGSGSSGARQAPRTVSGDEGQAQPHGAPS